MRTTPKIILTACTLAIGGASASAQLIINEIMQSNIDCIMDDLNEFPDSWVELYNAGTETAHLQEYSVLDKDKPAKAYQLPAIDVAPGAYVIVYCDKVGKGLHADFRLDSGKGGNIFLYHNGEVADKIENWKKQPAPNIAYGRKTDGDEKWGYMATPTPGAPNCGLTCKDILGEPVFSVPGRVGSDNFDLELSLPADAPEGAVIRFTLDGSEPTDSSAVYAEPLSIDTTALVRAKIYCDGYLSPRSTTHSYIWHPCAATLPVVSIVTDSSYFYGDSLGIYVQGTFNPDAANYSYDWRRPINLEFFEGEDTPSAINQLCETRVKGGASREFALKSLAFYANKRFGVKRFNCEFFPDQTPGISEFKSFEMRNAGNDFHYAYMRDCIMQQVAGLNVDIDWQPSRPAIVYINGEYKGILNIRPRSNEDYVYSYYDGLEDVDVIETWTLLKEGTLDNFNAFNAFYSEDGHTLAEYDELMDVSEFCDYMLTNIFFDNKDFPGNNVIQWRPTAEGGRWRWILKDTDFGMGLYKERFDYPTFTWLFTPGYDDNKRPSNTESGTRLFRHLLDIREFKDMFIDRTAVYLGDFMRPEKIISLIDARYDAIKDEYARHSALTKPFGKDYDQEVEIMREWTRNRWDFYYDHIQETFDLGPAAELAIDKGRATGRTLTVNGIELKGDEFDGKYFRGRTLTVQALTEAGAAPDAWEVAVTDLYGNLFAMVYEVEILSLPIPKAAKIEIKSLYGDEVDGIADAVADFDLAQPCEIYDLAGRYIGTAASNDISSAASPGVYILRQGFSTRKITIK